ncbi:MAG: hypothetical protein AB1Z98_15320 [Nannocystaceae bacterium]
MLLVPFFGYAVLAGLSLIRKQHPSFGKEIRALIGSGQTEDKEIAGIVVSELDALAKARESGSRYPKENQLNGALSEIHYLRIYRGKYSIRVYYIVLDGSLMMLCLDKAKRRNKLDAGTEQRLQNRLKEANALRHGENRKSRGEK